MCRDDCPCWSALAIRRDRIIVATDHEDVTSCGRLTAGGEVCMTRRPSVQHQVAGGSGGKVRVQLMTHHYRQYCSGRWADDPPGDLSPGGGESGCQQQRNGDWRYRSAMRKAFNLNAVKVVMDAKGYALYFSARLFLGSRSALPKPARPSVTPAAYIIGTRYIALGFIRRCAQWAPGPLSRLKCHDSCECCMARKSMLPWRPKCPAPGVDTAEDLGASALSCVDLCPSLLEDIPVGFRFLPF